MTQAEIDSIIQKLDNIDWQTKENDIKGELEEINKNLEKISNWLQDIYHSINRND